MKTSKIIFFTLLGSIAIIILAAVLDVRFTGKKRSLEFSSSDVTERIPLASYSVICVKNITTVYLRQSDSVGIEFSSMENTNKVKPLFEVKSDTLFLSYSQKLLGRGIPIQLSAPDALKEIKVINSNLTLLGSWNPKERFLMDIEAGKVFAGTADLTVSKFTLTAAHNSFFNGSGVKCDTIDLVLDHSQATLYANIRKINVSLSEKSAIYTGHSNRIPVFFENTDNKRVN